MNQNVASYAESIVTPSDGRHKVVDVKNGGTTMFSAIGTIVSEYLFVDEDNCDRPPYRETTKCTATVVNIRYPVHDCADTRPLIYILTCAHALRHHIYRCTCCNQYTFHEHKCENGGSSFECIMLKPHVMEFHTHSTEERIAEEIDDRTYRIILYGDITHRYSVESGVADIFINDAYCTHPVCDSGNDYAMVISREPALANYCKNAVRPIVFTNYQAIFNANTNISMWGYPADKRNKNDHSMLYGMQSTFGVGSSSVYQHYGTKKCYLRQTMIDSHKGQSGAALFANVNGVVNIFGVHTGGKSENNIKYNIASIFDLQIINMMNQFVEQTLGICNSAKPYIRRPMPISPASPQSPTSPESPASSASPNTIAMDYMLFGWQNNNRINFQCANNNNNTNRNNYNTSANNSQYQSNQLANDLNAYNYGYPQNSGSNAPNNAVNGYGYFSSYASHKNNNNSHNKPPPLPLPPIHNMNGYHTNNSHHAYQPPPPPPNSNKYIPSPHRHSNNQRILQPALSIASSEQQFTSFEQFDDNLLYNNDENEIFTSIPSRAGELINARRTPNIPLNTSINSTTCPLQNIMLPLPNIQFNCDSLLPYLSSTLQNNMNGNNDAHESVASNSVKTYDTDKPYQCTICSKRLQSKRSFDQHMENHNGAERTHTCPICRKQFYQKAHMNQHVLGVHKKAPVQCTKCNDWFATQHYMRKHRREDH